MRSPRWLIAYAVLGRLIGPWGRDGPPGIAAPGPFPPGSRGVSRGPRAPPRPRGRPEGGSGGGHRRDEPPRTARRPGAAWWWTCWSTAIPLGWRAGVLRPCPGEGVATRKGSQLLVIEWLLMIVHMY